EPAEPGKAAAEPVDHVPTEDYVQRGTIGGRIDHVPQFGTENSSAGYVSDHAVWVEKFFELWALYLSVQDKGRRHQGPAHHEEERWQLEIPDVDVRKQSGSFRRD